MISQTLFLLISQLVSNYSIVWPGILDRPKCSACTFEKVRLHWNLQCKLLRAQCGLRLSLQFPHRLAAQGALHLWREGPSESSHEDHCLSLRA